PRLHLSRWVAPLVGSIGAPHRRHFAAARRVLHWPLRHSLLVCRRFARWWQFPDHRTQGRGVRSDEHLRRAQLPLLRLPDAVPAMGTGLRHRRREPREWLDDNEGAVAVAE